MKRLFIEMADTTVKREYGLKNRKYMPKNSGMLFKFPHSIYASFWMRDTYIPLDIAFLNDEGKILQIESLSPLSTKAVYSNDKCQYALEVNRGWFKENGIQVGSRICGEGLRGYKKIAQMTPQIATPPISGAVIGTPEAIHGQPLPNEAAPTQPNPSPDVILDLSFKDKLDKANLRGKSLIIIYRTKGGITLPPKVISPPFEFEEDAEGHHDAIVKAWDNQTGGWKSFLIDNILSLEEKK